MSQAYAPNISQSETNRSGPALNADSVSLKGWLAVIGSAIGAFMAVLDIQITSSSLKDIQGALGAGLDEGSWISTAYLIAEIVTIPMTGWLSQVFGLKRYVVVNAILFLIFSMLCGCATDLNGMIFFRLLQGFTGGTLIPMSFSIILSTLPPAKQPIGLAIFSLTAVFAPSIGPAIGGYLTDTLGWQYSFYLNLIPGLFLISVLWYALPNAPMKLDLLKKGDYFGIVTMAIGLSCLTYALEEGQRKDWFGSETITNASIVAAISLTLFIARALTARSPIVNVKLLARRNFGLGTFINIVQGLALYGTVYLLPFYLSITQGYSAWQIGQVMIWAGLPQLLITPLVPLLMKRFDPRWMLIYGLIMFGCSCLLNAFMTHDYAANELTLSMIVRAFGQPFVMIPLSAIATNGIEKEQAGSASGLFNMMRNLGGSIGIAVVSTVLTQREQFHSVRLGERISSSDPAVRGFIAQTQTMLFHRGAGHFEAHNQALGALANMVRKEAYIMAFNDCFLFVSCALFVAAVCVFFLKKPQGPLHAAAE
jgi:DHA2 family multidrug resistance protein